ncbi:hypothetical protein M3929_003306 [Vibrio metschnikovii]|nr:hypothetical protein [Vibrio metschnikovii]
MTNLELSLKKANFYLNQCVEKKLWHLGYAFIKSSEIPLERIKHPWLIDHISYVVENQKSYMYYISEHEAKKRLSCFLDYDEYLGLTTICAGKININIFVHEIFKNGKNFKVLEKIYSSSKQRSLMEEKKLFDSFSNSKILAPKYYGLSDGGAFISSYWEYVHGENCSQHKFEKIVNKLVIKLWEAPVDASDIGVKVSRLSYSKPEVFEKIRALEKKYNLLISCIDSFLEFLLVSSRNAPYVISNTDLHANNVILKATSGHAVIIDWDKYAIVNPGKSLIMDSVEEADAYELIEYIKLKHKHMANSFISEVFLYLLLGHAQEKVLLVFIDVLLKNFQEVNER